MLNMFIVSYRACSSSNAFICMRVPFYMSMNIRTHTCIYRFVHSIVCNHDHGGIRPTR